MSSMYSCEAIGHKMSSITFSRRYSSSTSSRPMINRAVVEYINEEQLIGRTPDLK